MPDIGVPELLIVAVIVILLFGPGKVADVGGALGKSIREFRIASREEESPAAPAQTPAASPRFCSECGAATVESQRFCSNCGTGVSAGGA